MVKLHLGVAVAVLLCLVALLVQSCCLVQAQNGSSGGSAPAEGDLCLYLCAQLSGDTWSLALSVQLEGGLLSHDSDYGYGASYLALNASGWRYFTDLSASSSQNVSVLGVAPLQLLSGVDNVVTLEGGIPPLSESGLGLLLSELPLSPFPYNGTGLDVDGLSSGIAAGTQAALRVFYNADAGTWAEQVSAQTMEAAAVGAQLTAIACSSVGQQECAVPQPPYSSVQQYALCAAYAGVGFASATSARLSVLSGADGLDLVLAASGWRAFLDVSGDAPAQQNLTVTGISYGQQLIDPSSGQDSSAPKLTFGLSLRLSGVPALYGSLSLSNSSDPSSLSYVLLQDGGEGLGYVGEEVDGEYYGFVSEFGVSSAQVSLQLLGLGQPAPPCSLPSVLPPLPPSTFYLCAQLAGDGWASTTFAQLEATGPYSDDGLSYYRVVNASGQRVFSAYNTLPVQMQTISILGVASPGTLYDNNNRLYQPSNPFQRPTLDDQGVVFLLSGIPQLFNETQVPGSTASFSPQPLISLREVAVVSNGSSPTFLPIESDAIGFESAQADDTDYYYLLPQSSIVRAQPAADYDGIQPVCGLLDYDSSPTVSSLFSLCLVFTGPFFGSATLAILNATAPTSNSLSEYTVQSASGWRAYRELLLHGGSIAQNLSITGVAPAFTDFYNDNLLYVQGSAGSALPSAAVLDDNGLGLTFASEPWLYGYINAGGNLPVDAIQYAFTLSSNYTEALPGNQLEYDLLSSHATLLPYTEGGDMPQCELPALTPPPPQVLETTTLCSVISADFWASYISADISLLSPDPDVPTGFNQLALNATGWRYYIDTSQVPPYTENLTITGIAAVGSLNGNDNLLSAGYPPLDTSGLVFTFDSVPTVYQPEPIAGTASTPYSPRRLLRLFVNSSVGESNAEGWSESPAPESVVSAALDTDDFLYCPAEPPQPVYSSPLISWTVCAQFEGPEFASATFAYINASELAPFDGSAYLAVLASGWRVYQQLDDGYISMQEEVAITGVYTPSSFYGVNGSVNDNRYCNSLHTAPVCCSALHRAHARCADCFPLCVRFTPYASGAVLDTGGLAFITTEPATMFGVFNYDVGNVLLLGAGNDSTALYFESNSGFIAEADIASSSVTFARYTGPGSEVACSLPSDGNNGSQRVTGGGDLGVAAVLSAAGVAPPVFELNFTSDPIAHYDTEYLSDYRWSWAANSSTDSEALQLLHQGLAVLDGSETAFIDLTTATGPNSADTVMPMIGGPGSGRGDTEGWSIEMVFQPQQVDDFAKLLCLGAGEAGNDILLGWLGDDETGTMAFEQYVDEPLVNPSATYADTALHSAPAAQRLRAADAASVTGS